MPSVSVIVAAFNAKAFIDRALLSVIGQTYADWELIVVDDCSSDGTFEHVMAAFSAEPRIKCYRLAQNQGPGAARNHGMRLATGKWLTVLDSDDMFLPGRIENLVGICESASLDLIADNQQFFDAARQLVFQDAFRLRADWLPLSAELLVRNDGPPLRFSFGALKPLVRKAFLTEHGIRYPEHLRVGEDFAFLFECLQRKARARLVATPGYVYTVPVIRAKAASTTTRTNYGKGNIETLIESNAQLREALVAGPDARRLASLLRVRHRRLQCALALRDRIGLAPRQTAAIFGKETAWVRYFLDKVRNVFQRSHAVRLTYRKTSM